MTQDTKPTASLTERTGFWLALAAVLAALGGAGFGIAIAEYHPPWMSGWFIAGAVFCGLGCLSSLWALVLYVAHRVAGAHWCPDPQAHVAIAQQSAHARQMSSHTVSPRPSAAAVLAAMDATSRGELARWLRPVLREMNGDLRQAAAGIERALGDDSYVAVQYEFNVGNLWESNRERLAGLPGRGDLYDNLREAYAHITRLRTIIQGSPMQPGATAPTLNDDLDSALAVIHKAEAAVNKELSEIG